MKKFSELFSVTSDSDFRNLEINGIAFDSRKVLLGDLFFAISGEKFKGSDFVEQAVSNGAVAVVLEKTDSTNLAIPTNIPTIFVKDIRFELARVSSVFFNEPSLNLSCVGITGTNGKTSIAWILANLVACMDWNSAMIGTLGMKCLPNGPEVATQNTTPSSYEIQSFLSSLCSETVQCDSVQGNAVKLCAIEATSQGIAQKRTNFLHWDATIFTNLTRDHLDLHGSFEAYGALKSKLFKEQLVSSQANNKFAVINIDDSWGKNLYLELKELGIDVMSVSLKDVEADVYCSSFKNDPSGLTIKAKLDGSSTTLQSQLIGTYNVENILAAMGCLFRLNYDLDSLSLALKNVPCVPGRLQRVPAEIKDSEIYAFVDYAHTPDALSSLLDSVRELASGRIITVFGCGGDRDRGKRPLMAQAVESGSELAVITSDNPRTESPEAIVADVSAGFSENSKCSWQVVVDRRSAISAALDLASPGDIVLIAGKGHEDYQEIHGKKYDFEDARVCLELMHEKGLV